MVTVAVDAMGGDKAPGEIVKGCIRAAEMSDDIRILLVGREEVVNRELASAAKQKDAEKIKIINATEVIETGDPPVLSIQRKKDSSIVVGMKLVKNGEADAFVSAGSSGAVLVGGQVIVGRIKGVERPPFATLVPTDGGTGASLLLDCGANVDARPEHLKQFAQMGSIYMERIMGIKNPRVAIVNIGLEEEKGNALVKATIPLLKDLKGINFTGSIEAREIPHDGADVIVCEAFTGNVIIKLYEGVASCMLHTMKKAMLSDFRSKAGAALLKPALKNSLKAFDVSRYGGAPMLGLKGLVVKVHGNAEADEINNAVLQCRTFCNEKINDHISEEITDGI
jgi:glycerol-3-phosphate acyltransferase PlsX